MSPVQIHARRKPVIHNVHDVAEVLSEVVEEIHDAEMKADAIGMSLYRIAPIDPLVEQMMEDRQEDL